jgi:menaquinone-dependent protoporphyrinogen oxidase
MHILVAYASRHGATRGIAEHIAHTLESNGLDVTIRPVEGADRVDHYDAFVIGSAAYMGGWLDQATAFVRRHREVLAAHPVWLFSSGPVGPDAVGAKGRDPLQASTPKEFAEFTRTIGPRDEHVFFGAYDPAAPPTGLAESLMTRFVRLIPEVRKALPTGDYRDWPAIGAWAEGIARELRPVGATA